MIRAVIAGRGPASGTSFWPWLVLTRGQPAMGPWHRQPLGWVVNVELPVDCGCVSPRRAQSPSPPSLGVELHLDSLGPVCSGPQKSKSHMCAGAGQSLGVQELSSFPPSVAPSVVFAPALVTHHPQLPCPTPARRPRSPRGQDRRTLFVF